MFPNVYVHKAFELLFPIFSTNKRTLPDKTLTIDVWWFSCNAGLTADQRRKVNPWSQFFRCAAFKGSSTASTEKKQFCSRSKCDNIHASVLWHSGCHGDGNDGGDSVCLYQDFIDALISLVKKIFNKPVLFLHTVYDQPNIVLPAVHSAIKFQLRTICAEVRRTGLNYFNNSLGVGSLQ